MSKSDKVYFEDICKHSIVNILVYKNKETQLLELILLNSVPSTCKLRFFIGLKKFHQRGKMDRGHDIHSSLRWYRNGCGLC